VVGCRRRHPLTAVANSSGVIVARIGSRWLHLNAINLAGAHVHGDGHRPAADFAIGGELLRGLAGVNEHLELLSAKWALYKFGFLHKTCGVPGLRLR